MTATIRPMIRRDKAAIMEMLKITPEFKPSEIIIAEEVIDNYLVDPIESGYHIAVSEIDSRITGYICYGPAPLTEGTWDIYWLAVSPERQGNGIGHSLMQFAEERIKRARGRLALIETSGTPEYKKTRRFHRNQGYEIICSIPDYYASGDDKIIFQKRFS